MILSGVFSLLIGAISLRLTQEYFAIGTIAFASVVTAVLINWRGLTRGVLGIPGIPRPELSGLDMYETSSFLLLSSITAFLVLALYYVVFRSSFARALRAQGESEIVAQSLGIHSRKVKTVSFVFSAATAGLAGSYFSYYFSFIDPSSFSFTEMVFVLTVGIVGKPGSFWGVTAATFFLVLLPEPLRFLKIDSSIVGPMRQLLYAILLFIAVAVKRKNLFPMERKV